MAVTADRFSTADYCRRARRLRANFQTRPALLHAALCGLARQHDKPYRQERTLDCPVRISHSPTLPASRPSIHDEEGLPRVIERAFVDHVAQRLHGRVLRYSDRLKLLKAAERLRIGRFRANLVIAMVQHQRVEAGTSAIVATDQASARWWSIGGLAGLAALVELTMVMFCWRWFFS